MPPELEIIDVMCFGPALKPSYNPNKPFGIQRSER